MRETDFCLCENKGVDQLCSNCTADQRLCFHYTESTIPLLSRSGISSLKPTSVLVCSSLVGNHEDCFFRFAAHIHV